MTKKIFTLVAFFLLLSCADSEPIAPPVAVDYTAKNEQEIKDYLAKNNITTAQRTDSGLYYTISEPGTGTNPTVSSNVTVAYKGYLTNGQVFDQSTAAGVAFPLSNLIKGWQEGIPFFKPGGKGVLFIPAHLGYGGRNQGPIPPGSVMIFEIHLISVN
jgi:FKBP-type peptidyl-prolyl cis-trans isomerase FkpA